MLDNNILQPLVTCRQTFRYIYFYVFAFVNDAEILIFASKLVEIGVFKMLEG